MKKLPNVQHLLYSRAILNMNLKSHKVNLKHARKCLKRGYDDKYWQKLITFHESTVNDLTEALKILNQYY